MVCSKSVYVSSACASEAEEQTAKVLALSWRRSRLELHSEYIIEEGSLLPATATCKLDRTLGFNQRTLVMSPSNVPKTLN